VYSTKGIGGHRRKSLCHRYPTSDIEISYSDIGTKYVGLNPFIPISEEFRYQNQLPFRYGLYQYRISQYLKLINQSEMTLIKFYNTHFFTLVLNQQSSRQVSSVLPLCYEDLHIICRISEKSLFRYPTKCRTLRSSVQYQTVRYQTFRYQTQSDIADHGYRTECPPMTKGTT
jgi:hypothetical protein